MSGKQEKKIRQLFRKEVGRELEALQYRFRDLIKPSPKWCPRWLWKRLTKIFLNIE